jgi:CDP-6-deoxy-D-xylo-4-hexulose-3-dehydrase
MYPLATSSWDREEIDAMQRVISSGNFTMGKEVKAFEDMAAAHFGSKYAVMVNSGSSANLLMTAALFYRKSDKLAIGDTVLVPAVSWATTYYPLQQYGLYLRFVDTDPKTFNYNMDRLEEAVTPLVRAIMVPHILGNPHDMDRLMYIAKDHDIIVIEDNCESMGATFGGKQLGTFGLMGSMSCFFSHHISTMEGGLVLTDDEECYQILLCLRAHGWTRNLPKNNLVSGKKSDDPFEENFKFILPGYNVRPLELSGAIGQIQLRKLPEFVRARRENAEYFLGAIKRIPWVQPQTEVGESSWFGFGMILDEGVDRRKVVEALSTHGIDTRPIVSGNFCNNPVIKHFQCSIPRDLDGADIIDKRGLFVGNHHYDIRREIDLLVKVLETC